MRVPHRLASERRVQTSEHEILLAFDNDDGARAFYAWWADRGSEEFAEWCAHFSEWQHVVSRSAVEGRR